MQEYHNLLKYILNKGEKHNDRTGIGTISIFGYQIRLNLNNGFPLLTTKKMHIKSIIYELLWFLKGSTNIKYLKDNDVHIWDAWADKDGNIGPMYGKQWKNWNGIDQISKVINEIKTNPHSRRLIISSWNVEDLEKMALPPCHIILQFYICNNKKLSLQVYQRSADVFLGLPFNIASYSLLIMMIAQITNLKIGNFIHTLGNVHIYQNHLDQVKLQLSRKPKKLPNIILNKKIKSLFDFKFKDFTIQNYDPYPKIKAPIAI